MHDLAISTQGKFPENLARLKARWPHARIVHGTPWDAVISQTKNAVTEFSWVVSDSCDYSSFDSNWEPKWHQAQQFHTWPTAPCKRTGETYFFQIKTMRENLAKGVCAPHECDQYNTEHEPVFSLVKSSVVIVDHGDGNTNAQDRWPDARVFRKVGTWPEMLKRISQHVDDGFWVVSTRCVYDDFDFNWKPEWDQTNQIHVWPNHGQVRSGDTFWVNNASLLKADELNFNTAHSPVQVRPWPLIQPNTRKFGSRTQQVARAARHATTPWFWYADDAVDPAVIPVDWTPEWDQERNLHVWSCGNQTLGGEVMLVNRGELLQQSPDNLLEYQTITWHNKNLPVEPYQVCIIDTGQDPGNLKQRWPEARVFRYFGSHLELLQRIALHAKGTHVWVVSTCCNYSDFDFNWRPSWEKENHLHVWASDNQRMGDTFLLPLSEFRTQAANIDRLEYFNSVTWHSLGVARWPWPVNRCTGDLMNAVKNHQFRALYEWFVAPGSELSDTATPCLWKERSLEAFGKNGHVCLVPRDTKAAISTKLADYHNIKYHKNYKSTKKAQDVVFISYDEKNAEKNWKKLKKSCGTAQRVHGVEGMVNAIKQAAALSSTPWFYAVFAKTNLADDFAFDHQPDYLETPGHYVFYSYNPVLDHSYGHDGVVMYHRQTVLDACDWKIDFTMSAPVTTIPVVSCRNDYAYSAYSSWRTAIREAYKLRQLDGIDDQWHLHLWLTSKRTKYGDWSQKGAEDAMQLSLGLDEQINNWHWLHNYFQEKYPDTVSATYSSS